MTAIPIRLKHRLGIWTLAVAIAFVAGGALAHELDHQFHKHDLPCALHFYAGHLDGIATSGAAPPAVVTGSTAPITAASGVLARQPIWPYAVRAPPLFSLR